MNQPIPFDQSSEMTRISPAMTLPNRKGYQWRHHVGSQDQRRCSALRLSREDSVAFILPCCPLLFRASGFMLISQAFASFLILISRPPEFTLKPSPGRWVILILDEWPVVCDPPVSAVFADLLFLPLSPCFSWRCLLSVSGCLALVNFFVECFGSVRAGFPELPLPCLSAPAFFTGTGGGGISAGLPRWCDCGGCSSAYGCGEYSVL